MDFSLQSLFLTVLTRVIQDGLADIFLLHMMPIKAKEAAQQQVQLQKRKAQGDALKQQYLMKRQAQIRVEEEGETGLVIRRALYGTKPSLFLQKTRGIIDNEKPGAACEETRDQSNSNDRPCILNSSSTVTEASHPISIAEAKEDEILDVTVPLQFWVQQGQLELPAVSKRNMLGFYDPQSPPGNIVNNHNSNSHSAERGEEEYWPNNNRSNSNSFFTPLLWWWKGSLLL